MKTKNHKRTCQRCTKACWPNYFYCQQCHEIKSEQVGALPEEIPKPGNGRQLPKKGAD